MMQDDRMMQDEIGLPTLREHKATKNQDDARIERKWQPLDRN